MGHRQQSSLTAAQTSELENRTELDTWSDPVPLVLPKVLENIHTILQTIGHHAQFHRAVSNICRSKTTNLRPYFFESLKLLLVLKHDPFTDSSKPR